VHGGPSEPSPEPAYLHLAALQHSKTLADHRHAALVKVAKWARRKVTYDAAVNQLSGITSLLNRYLSNPWQRFAILVKRGRIAHHKNLGVSGHSKIFLNAYPPGAICFDVEPLARRRGCDACSPDHRFACDALARDYNAFRVDLIDTMS